MAAGDIGCIIMASGLSVRYGRDKLLEALGGREVILHVADRLRQAGFAPVAVTRSRAVAALLEREGFAAVLHDGPRKSDTIHAGLERIDPNVPGVLFMPGDQPLVRPSSLRRLAERFERCPERAVRLGFGDRVGSPVIFPAALRDALIAYTGDRGGAEVLRRNNIPCDVAQAADAWELWDVDTPEKMERVRAVYSCHATMRQG